MIVAGGLTCAGGTAMLGVKMEAGSPERYAACSEALTDNPGGNHTEVCVRQWALE